MEARLSFYLRHFDRFINETKLLKLNRNESDIDLNECEYENNLS